MTVPRLLVDLLSITGKKGGMEVAARELYRELGSLAPGYEYIGLMSAEGYALDRSWFPGDTIDTGISGDNRFAWARGELFAVSRHADRLGADLVHSPLTLGPRKTRMPAVVTIHDMLYWSHPQYMSTPLYTEPVKLMERLTARNATRIMTDSDSSAREIHRHLGTDPGRIDVVPLAGTLLPGVDRSLAGSEGAMVLATGNRRPHKNWDGLLRALPLIDPAERPRVVVTGSHGDDPLRPVVDELGLGEWVELRGWISTDEMTRLYSTATVLAMPSFADGFSLPALEAMMVGLPVMISDIPVYREVVGDAALLIDPNSLDSIAAAMRVAVTDPDTMARLSAEGLARAGLFSWEKTARAVLATFERTLSEDPRANA